MSGLRLAILGATGAVGEQALKVLEERNFPVSELRLLGSSRSAGTEMSFCSEKIKVQQVDDGSFNDIDIVLSAVSSELSGHFTPIAVKSGAIVIDNSSRFRMDNAVPLVVPEINPQDAHRHSGIIANPCCTIIITLVAINALNRHSPVTRMIASSYQAVSGVGKEGIAELEEQTRRYVGGEKPEIKIFKHQILHNMIPHIDDFCENGYTKEEMKLLDESRKILHSPGLLASCTCVRVPAMRSHSVSVMIETKEQISVETARELISRAPGVKLRDDVFNNVYPMPLDTSGQDLVYVGRIRRDLSGEGLMLWCCGDQLRKGAATNAVQIAELFLSDSRGELNAGR